MTYITFDEYAKAIDDVITLVLAWDFCCYRYGTLHHKNHDQSCHLAALIYHRMRDGAWVPPMSVRPYKAIDDVITQGTRLLDGVYGGGWEVLRESLRQLIYHRMKGWAPPMTNYVATYSHLSEVLFADYWPKR